MKKASAAEGWNVIRRVNLGDRDAPAAPSEHLAAAALKGADWLYR